uniref:Toxin-antitoxin system HicB family antitoxin n=1 Tax=uncultured Thiotrichaceae bacterium TaxID=298394 RepID=A0A6S6SFK5_9GAMM|nr:MAG: Toxin-antitoxin system HicB family antitoxin [uncultured Thiotrichaceae bacterium]
MGNYALRLPDSLLEQARKTAKKDSVSMNQLFISAIAEKLAVLEAESLILQRAANANKQAFESILDRVPDNGVVSGDEITG